VLVFDAVDKPELTGVVPGGGIEPGESVEEAALREVIEETGLEVRVVREIGFLEQPGLRDPSLLHESHFVQAVPKGPTQDDWEHFVVENEIEQGPVRCRWVQILAGMSVWGVNRGAFLEKLLRKRVVGYVTRGRELLVFDHAGTTQLPAGRIDAHETLEEGLAREVEEETGIDSVAVVGELADAAEFARLYGPGAHESHALHAVTNAETPDAWDHHVTGTGMDAGIVYPCRWVSLDECPPLWGRADPLVETLRQSMTER
jgi:8-oxo-dGTP pyrophosphatase MutT (NUDIX family)